MEPNTPVICKKLCNMLRLVFFMVQKGVTKSKLMVDLQLLMKRGKILGKAVNELMIRHHTTLSCRSDDMHMSFVSPKEYEFSCSNSPAFQTYIPFHVSSKRKSHYPYAHYKHHAHNYRRSHAPPTFEDVVAVLAGLGGGGGGGDGGGDVVEESPLVGPVVRRVRITDSPFPLEDADKDCHVDKLAEEFIKKFYKQLRLQKSKSVREAAYH